MRCFAQFTPRLFTPKIAEDASATAEEEQRSTEQGTLMLALCSTPLALRVGSVARSTRGIVRMNANLPTTADVTDVREWLEEVEGEDALAWVKEQNADAISTFGEP